MRIDTFIIWFLLPIITSCATYKIEKNTPIFLDTDRGYGRVYNVEKISPKQCGGRDYEFKYTGQNIPLNQMNGYICLPVDQAQYNIRYYDEYIKQQAHCQ
jgi:hypothetical protein